MKQVRARLALAVFLSISFANAFAQAQEIQWSAEEKPIYDKIHTLRQLPDDVRGGVTRDLALQIRGLSSRAEKVYLAVQLAGRSTEGDFGHEMLQEVATTLADTLREHPLTDPADHPEMAYETLAELVRYEHVEVSLDDPQYKAALAKLEKDDEVRQKADFTLTDIRGKAWSLSSLRGKVVLVNFWATWCPPCRKEMPDLESLYHEFHKKGFVILAVSDEEAGKVKPFIKERKITYPVLFDPGRKVNDLFQIEGIPKSFVYDRDGRLVAQSIDMRTRHQFLEMLGQAGLK